MTEKLSAKLSGYVHKVFAPYSKGNFKKIDFVLIVKSDESHSQYIKFTAFADLVYPVQILEHNKLIVVHFNIRGRMWQNKNGEKLYFNDLSVFRIDTFPEDKRKPEIIEAQDPNIDQLPF